jgi:hypothetical protein
MQRIRHPGNDGPGSRADGVGWRGWHVGKGGDDGSGEGGGWADRPKGGRCGCYISCRVRSFAIQPSIDAAMSINLMDTNAAQLLLLRC